MKTCSIPSFEESQNTKTYLISPIVSPVQAPTSQKQGTGLAEDLKQKNKKGKYI